MHRALKILWAKRPLFVTAAGAVVVLALDGWQLGSAWVALALMATLITWMGGWKSGLATSLLAMVLMLHLRFQDDRQAREEALFSRLPPRLVEGRLLEDAVAGRGTWSATARLHSEELGGAKVRWAGTGEAPPAGTELRAFGIFNSLETDRNPGTLNRSERLRSEGVVAVFRASEMRQERWIGPVSKRAAAFKRSFRESIAAGLDEDGVPVKVIRAVVLGERSPDSLELLRHFRESGTLHVFTVSGLHVMMVGTMIWFLMRWTGTPRRWALPVIIAGMFGYAWLTGNGPAAIRAAWMGAVFLGAFALRRRTDLLNALGAVLLLTLIWDPRMIRMPSVQLSYGVVASIGVATVAARKCFEWIADEETFLPPSEMGWWEAKRLRFRRWLAEGFAVSTAASIGSAPLTILHFGVVTPISIIATVALVPIVYGLLGIALLSAVVNPVWQKGSIGLNSVNSSLAGLCANAAAAFAKIPGASAPTRFPEEESLVIYDLDFGAAAACFASATRNAVMIDTGGTFSLEREVGPSMRRLGIYPDSVIFTHADGGHVVGPELITQMFTIRQLAIGAAAPANTAASEWLGAPPSGPRIIRPRAGDLLALGGGTWVEILLSPLDNELGSLADDRVLIFMMHWKGWKILWHGDAGRLSERALLDSGIDLTADVIIAGSHESDLSLSNEYISAVTPRLIVLPRPPGSDADAMRESQRREWRQSGIQILDQALTGGLTLTIGADEELVFSGFLDGSRTALSQKDGKR